MTITGRLASIERAFAGSSPDDGHVTIQLTDDRSGLRCLPVMVPALRLTIERTDEPEAHADREALTLAERWQRNIERHEAGRGTPEPIIDADMLSRLLGTYGCWIDGKHHPDPPAWVRQRVDTLTRRY